MRPVEVIRLLDAGETVKFPIPYANSIFLELAKLRPKQKFVGILIGDEMGISWVAEKVTFQLN